MASRLSSGKLISMKFKNIKSKAKKEKYPSNPRTIAEHFKLLLPKINSTKLIKLYGGILKVFAVAIFVVTTIVVGYDFQKNLQLKQNIESQRKTIISDLNFWENFLSAHKNYRDAYFQASILEYRLGNISKAKMYVEKGLSLDPVSANGKKLEQFLAGK